MLFSSLKTAAALSLVSLALSSPTASPSPIYPPTNTGYNFQLIANVTSGDLVPSINHFAVSAYHIGAGEDVATLVPFSGLTFYVNGTAEDVRYGRSNVLTDLDGPHYPAGLSTTGATLRINGGNGEAGIGLTQFPDPIKELGAAPGGVDFYACQTVPEGGAESAIQVFSGKTAPEGCATITLMPQCDYRESGDAHPSGNLVNCYDFVAAIDWEFYDSD